jgi:hypothetical protein
LAQIDQKLASSSAAKAQYKEVIENGNKLWIVQQAQPIKNLIAVQLLYYN